MKLIVNKPIRGYVNRGTDDEKEYLYASPGDKLEIVFNNTITDESGNVSGHYVCTPENEPIETIIEEHLNFVVFPSQVFTLLDEKTKKQKDTSIEDSNINTEDDPFNTLLSDDDED
jgi:hypothetical protein